MSSFFVLFSSSSSSLILSWNASVTSNYCCPVPFKTAFETYKPVSFTAEKVLNQPSWADVEDDLEHTKFNEMDGRVNRTSFEGVYKIDPKSKLPL